jgi:hypothetical protein
MSPELTDEYLNFARVGGLHMQAEPLGAIR